MVADTVYKYSSGSSSTDTAMAALDHILERHPVWRGGRLSALAGTVPTGFDERRRGAPRRRLAPGGADRAFRPPRGLRRAAARAAGARRAFVGRQAHRLARA